MDMREIFLPFRNSIFRHTHTKKFLTTKEEKMELTYGIDKGKKGDKTISCCTTVVNRVVIILAIEELK